MWKFAVRVAFVFIVWLLAVYTLATSEGCTSQYQVRDIETAGQRQRSGVRPSDDALPARGTDRARARGQAGGREAGMVHVRGLHVQRARATRILDEHARHPDAVRQ